MSSVTIRHLRYFDALAREGHFGRAAEACAISQPALSVQIRELESLLGATLVERGGRRIALTPVGEAVAARAGGILRAVDELGDLARAGAGALTGELRLGLIPTIAPYLFPAIFAEIALVLPGLDLRPREAITRRLVDDLRAGRLDVAIVALPISEPSLVEHALFEEEFVLARRAADADEPAPGPEQLARMRLLLLEEGHCFREQALSFCNLSPTPPRDLIEGGSLSTLAQMVGAGIGVTLLPAMAVALETRSSAIAVTPLPEPAPKRRVGMIWRAGSPLAGHFLRLAELVRAAAGQGDCNPIDARLAGREAARL